MVIFAPLYNIYRAKYPSGLARSRGLTKRKIGACLVWSELLPLLETAPQKGPRGLTGSKIVCNVY